MKERWAKLLGKQRHALDDGHPDAPRLQQVETDAKHTNKTNTTDLVLTKFKNGGE